MPVDPPDSPRLRSIAQRYGLGLTDADLASFRPLVDGLLASWGAVEELYAASAAARCRSAPGAAPTPADNPFNAWYVTTSITGSGEGPLAGKTVAVKDNTAVAGVPMMNGSGTMEGYTPLRDATVVSRMLAAGATITGKAVCEDLCFSGGSHTSRTGPVRNPWDETRSAGGSSSGSAALVMAGHRRRGHRRRPGRLGAHPERLQRHRRAQADLGPGALHRRVPDRADDRPRRADHPHGRRRRAGAERDRRARTGSTRASPATSCPTTTWPRSPAAPQGLRVGVVTEGFGHPNSEPAVDDTVRAAVETLRGRGPRRRGRLDPVAPARRQASGTSSPPRARPARWWTATATA